MLGLLLVCFQVSRDDTFHFHIDVIIIILYTTHIITHIKIIIGTFEDTLLDHISIAGKTRR